MDRLPDEMLLMIFERLSIQDLLEGCARVCQRWRELVRLRAVQIRHFRQGLSCITRRTHLVLVVTPFAHVCWVLQYLHELRSPLQLRALTVHAAAPLSYLQFDALHRLPHLRHLDVFMRIRLLDWRVRRVTDRLHSLVINDSSGLKLFPTLAASPSLRSVHMYGRSLYYLPEGLSLLLNVRRSWLTDLTLRCQEVPDAVYEFMGMCENLVSLQLYSCWLMTKAGVVHVTRPPRLRRLHVTGARLVRSAALGALVASLPPRLEELALSVTCFDDEHATALAARVPGLRVLELWGVRLTAGGAVTLAVALPELRVLDLDLELSAAAVRDLCALPALEMLRCMPAEGVGVGAGMGRSGRVRVVAADERYARRYFREGGEGYRGALFYYWTQDRPLEPLPENPPPESLEPDDFLI